MHYFVKQPELLDSLPPVTQLLILRNLLGIPTQQSPSACLEVELEEDEEMEDEAIDEEDIENDQVVEKAAVLPSIAEEEEEENISDEDNSH